MTGFAVIFHFLVFQSMFFIKNRLLSKKIGKSIRGKNKEAVRSIIIIAITFTAVVLSISSDTVNEAFIPLYIFSVTFFQFAGTILLIYSLVISLCALIRMKDSWRVGIKEEDTTDLVTDGIYGISRNPYFLSYDLMFIAYFMLVPNIAVIALSALAMISIHIMILKEEKFLESLHGDKYLKYKNEVPRYFSISDILLAHYKIFYKGYYKIDNP